jgi:hypothetical protein
MKQNPRPFLPQERAAPAKDAFSRAAFAAVIAADRSRNHVEIARELYPNNSAVEERLLERSAVTVATTATSGWASELALSSTGEFLATLGPLSAASQIIARGIRVDFASRNPAGELLPTRTGAPTALPWVAEGDPIPARAYNIGGATLGPSRKMALLVMMTREMTRRTSAEAIFRQLLKEDAAAGLDAGYFSADAGTDAVHAGLLNGLSPTTGGTGEVVGDMAALAREVAPGGSGEVVFIASKANAAQIPILNPFMRALVLGSDAVAEGRVIAVDPVGIVHGFDGAPDIDASIESVVHAETAPAQIATGAGVVAAPTRSLYQTDCVALRVLLDMAFVKRRANAVAYMDGVSWSG